MGASQGCPQEFCFPLLAFFVGSALAQVILVFPDPGRLCLLVQLLAQAGSRLADLLLLPFPSSSSLASLVGSSFVDASISNILLLVLGHWHNVHVVVRNINGHLPVRRSAEIGRPVMSRSTAIYAAAGGTRQRRVHIQAVVCNSHNSIPTCCLDFCTHTLLHCMLTSTCIFANNTTYVRLIQLYNYNKTLLKPRAQLSTAAGHKCCSRGVEPLHFLITWQACTPS